MLSLPERPAEFCRRELDLASEHYAAFVAAHSPVLERDGLFPRSLTEGKLWRVLADDWTSGFPAGCMWLLYEHTQQSAWREYAERFTLPLYEQRLNRETHDVGFMIHCSFGAGYRLTQAPSFREAVIDAARSLASRYNPKVRATRSWSFGDWSFPVIIDNMMNLELLWSASELDGDACFATLAIEHARTTQQNHFRPDASSYHLVDYDPGSGQVLKKQTHQGLNDESAWARGQAWGLYGFCMMHEKTGDPRFLEQASNIADFYVGHPSLPADQVPYFDFAVDRLPDVPKYRDASAGAIAASGLLRLSSLVDARRCATYREVAWRTLVALASPDYRARRSEAAGFLLKHSVGSYPEGHEVDACINYADYYYLEALMRGVEVG